MKQKLIAILMVLIIIAGITMPVHAEVSDSSWILTQHYGGGDNGMFYSLVKDDNLILIDGGWTANAEYVKAVIEENGGQVDYWFLTHYHEDHCGAFNALWPEYKDRIGTAYVTPLTWEEFEPYCRDWDTPDTFKLFLEQTGNAENIVPLHRGDELSIENLKINVFNAWDDQILPNSTDVANNCSLAFRIDTGKTSVLFMGDVVAAGLAELITTSFAPELLHADYVQAGHHGWGLRLWFYEAFQMKEMFIDASENLLYSDDYADKHGIVVKWCQENGIPIHDYSGVPYSVGLE